MGFVHLSNLAELKKRKEFFRSRKKSKKVKRYAITINTYLLCNICFKMPFKAYIRLLLNFKISFSFSMPGQYGQMDKLHLIPEKPGSNANLIWPNASMRRPNCSSTEPQVAIRHGCQGGRDVNYRVFRSKAASRP